jgi:Fe2+ or Zn2+ uptake regulation protein
VARRSLIPAAIIELMAHSERHAWTLEELRDGLSDAGQRADFSSVFRAAKKLVADGSVRKLALEDGRVCFEPVTAHHDHLQCTRCGTLVPVPCAIPQRTLAAVEARNGVTISDHRVIFMGLCPKCRTAADRRKKAS